MVYPFACPPGGEDINIENYLQNIIIGINEI